MPRLTIADFADARRSYRPSKVLKKFEALEDSFAEDKRRQAVLRKYKDQFSKSDRRDIKALLTHLNCPPHKREAKSCASSVDMRHYRNRWPGWLALYIERENIKPKFVTLQPAPWVIPVAALAKVNPRKFLQQVRNDLNRVGAVNADGGIVLGLDCELEPTSGNLIFHVHGLVWGGMLQVVEALRPLPKYAHDPNALNAGTGAVFRVHVQQVDDNLLSSITYIAKSFWCQRHRTILPSGRVTRTRGKQRIKGRDQAAILMWMHRQRYSTLFLTMKMQVTREGFKPRISKRE